MSEKLGENKQKNVLKSALAMATGTMSSRILGLLRDVLLAAFFPARVTDAFLAAFMIPNKFRRILGEGSLSVSMIPVYVESLQKKGKESAKELAGSIWVLLSLVTSVICVFAVLFMDQIMPLIVNGKGFHEIPGKVELTVSLGKILFSYLFLVTSYAFFMAIANAHKYFLIPAMGPTAFNFVLIVFSFLSYKLDLLEGRLLAIGVLVGGLVQFLIVFIFLFRKSLVPKFKLNLSIAGLGTVLRNMIPGILGYGVVQILSLINVTFASRLEEGTVSYIYYADRLLELPQSIIAISLGSALLPTLSQLYSENKISDFLKLSEKYQSILVFLSIPSCVGLFVLGEPLVQTIFQRGHVSDLDVQNIVIILQVYSFLLLAMSLNKILIPNLYAIKNTWLPAVIGIVTLGVHILMAPYWMESMGLRGLIISTAISGFLNMILIFISCQVMIGKTSFVKLLTSIVKSLVLASFMGLLLMYANQFIDFSSLNQFARVVFLLLLVCLGIIIYMGSAYLLRLRELQEVRALVGLRKK